MKQLFVDKVNVKGLTLEQVIQNNTSQYAPKANPTFTGTVTAPTIKATNLTVSGTLNIPGGQIWIE